MFTSLILMTIIYPVVGNENIPFSATRFSTPKNVIFLEANGNKWDRVAINGGCSFNIYTDIAQSGGGNVHYLYMINHFGYNFWYYIFFKADFRYLKYFSKNYNVRWFITKREMPGLKKIENELFEVEGYNSSFVEIVDSKTVKCLYFGDSQRYSNFFISLALSDPEDILTVYGGESINKYDVALLKNFDVIYLDGLRYTTLSNLVEISSVLNDYVEKGGSVILDTGNLPYGGNMKEIPDPFPVSETDTLTKNNITFHALTTNNIVQNIKFTKFDEGPSYVSYAVNLKLGAEALISDAENHILAAYWEKGLGKAVWIGLNMPYRIAFNQNDEESRFLANIIRYLHRTTSTRVPKKSVLYEYPVPETIVIDVINASPEDAIWFKMSYFPGWKAYIENEEIRIFQSGPNMMLVFPKRSGNYRIYFIFTKTLDVLIGEYCSLSASLLFVFVCFLNLLKYMKKKAYLANKWHKTEHKGFRYQKVKWTAK